MRSSYSGSVIGPKMSTCTLPRMFMPAPWITRTLGIALSVRIEWWVFYPRFATARWYAQEQGGVLCVVLTGARLSPRLAGATVGPHQEDHTHDHDGRVRGQGSRHARAHSHRRDGPALHQGSRRAEPVVHGGLAVRRTGGARDRLSAGG